MMVNSGLALTSEASVNQLKKDESSSACMTGLVPFCQLACLLPGTWYMVVDRVTTRGLAIPPFRSSPSFFIHLPSIPILSIVHFFTSSLSNQLSIPAKFPCLLDLFACYWLTFLSPSLGSLQSFLHALPAFHFPFNFSSHLIQSYKLLSFPIFYHSRIKFSWYAIDRRWLSCSGLCVLCLVLFPCAKVLL